MAGPTADFWQEKFNKNEIAWDRGAASPQLLAWLDSGALQPCRILVPGCGSGWEVAELARRGFEVVGLDYTEAAVARTQALCAEQGVKAEVVQADALTYAPSAPFDAIYEQTCLCAIHPDHWQTYTAQLHRWLQPGGQLWVLFMQMLHPAASEEGRVYGPPYHCDINAMRALLPAFLWDWPKPPYAKVMHPTLQHELALTLTRR